MTEKEEQRWTGGGWNTTDYTWTYEWDASDRLTEVEKEYTIPHTHLFTVEYKYCPTCGGAMTERIQRDGVYHTITSWLRYEYEGLNLLRIDERYDDDDPADGIDEDDPWRVLNVFVHGPGQIGQIVRNDYYVEGSASGSYYYYYDALGNVVGIIDHDGYDVSYEQDAFGNRIVGSQEWEPMNSPGPKEHLTGKMFDEVTGLYVTSNGPYDPETASQLSNAEESEDALVIITPDGPKPYKPPPHKPGYLMNCDCCPQLKNVWPKIKEEAKYTADTLIYKEGLFGELSECVKKVVDSFMVECAVGRSMAGVSMTSTCTTKPLVYFNINNMPEGYCNKREKNREFKLYYGQILAHEAAHVCNWNHGQGGGVPFPKPKPKPEEPDYGPYKPCDEWTDKYDGI